MCSLLLVIGSSISGALVVGSKNFIFIGFFQHSAQHFNSSVVVRVWLVIMS